MGRHAVPALFVLFALLAPLALLAPACDGRPQVDGPHLADPPEGFAFDPNCQSARTFLLGRAPRSQRCYEEHFSDAPDWITISTFEGPVDEAAANAARDAHEKQYGSPNVAEYSALQPLELAGRPGWCFFETDVYKGKTDSVTLYALVAVDGTTYALDYVVHARRPVDQAQMRTVLKSFAVR